MSGVRCFAAAAGSSGVVQTADFGERGQLRDGRATGDPRQGHDRENGAGLQLANFWQDVSRDLDKGRVYLPLEEMARYGYSEAELLTRTENEAFRQLMRFQVERTRELFREGTPLSQQVRRRLRSRHRAPAGHAHDRCLLHLRRGDHAASPSRSV
jgi:phytoene/squalene synthetase